MTYGGVSFGQGPFGGGPFGGYQPLAEAVVASPVLAQVGEWASGLSTPALVLWLYGAAEQLLDALSDPTMVAAEVVLVLFWLPLFLVLRRILAERLDGK